jgi:hypothetical protein
MLIKGLPFEEKLKLLDDADKDYLRGFMDRTLMQPAQNERKEETVRNGT